MAAKTDFSKPPEEILVALIKDANPTLNFSIEDVAFDAPLATTGDDAALRNTSVIVRATGTGVFTGLRDVIYDRIDLAEVLHHNVAPFVERTYQGTLRDLVPIINERYGVSLKRTDIVDQALPNLYGDITATVQASATSLIYQGSTTITVRRSMSLPVAVVDRFLNGIDYVSGPVTATAQDKLLARLNLENPGAPFAFSVSNVTFGVPASVSGPGYSGRVTVTAIPDHGFLGSVDVFYRRIRLSDVINTNTVGLYSDFPFTPQSLLDKLNAQLGLFLRLSDLQPLTIATPEAGVPYNVTLVARADSLGFRGTADLQIAVGLPPDLDLIHNLINSSFHGSLGTPVEYLDSAP